MANGALADAGQVWGTLRDMCYLKRLEEDAFAIEMGAGRGGGGVVWCGVVCCEFVPVGG